MKMRKVLVFGAVALIAIPAIVFVAGGFRIIVTQPIGAVLKGSTVIVSGVNTDKVHMLDSADAICQRENGGVSLLCRGATLAGIAKLGIIGLLPYLYLLFARGTDGPNRYDPTLSGPVFGRTRG